MLERVALHQTRLRTPGLRLDADGVALGSRGLVLLPSLDRLVAFLALYTAESSLGELLGSSGSSPHGAAVGLTIELCESRLKTREFVVKFPAGGTERLDRIAGVAHLAGGFTFTGSERFFVQYRDAASPFGYDLASLPPGDGGLALAHHTFEQRYEVVKPVDLAGLLKKLELVRARRTEVPAGARWILCEPAVGEALVRYFVRSEVEAEVGIVEWPPASALDPAPLRRYLFRVAALPPRTMGMLADTPGVGVYAPVAPGVAVELGWRHPVNLAGCPVFPEQGLVLLGGRGRSLATVAKLPALGPVGAFAGVTMRQGGDLAPCVPSATTTLELDIEVMPSSSAPRRVRATLVRDLGLLRLLAYRMGPATLREVRIALTDVGAFVTSPLGIDAMPIGEFYEELHPRLFVAAGHAPHPRVSAEKLVAALAAEGRIVFLGANGTKLAVAHDAFVPLGDALLGAQSWLGTTAEAIAPVLEAPLPTLALEPVEVRPMRDVADEDLRS